MIYISRSLLTVELILIPTSRGNSGGRVFVTIWMTLITSLNFVFLGLRIPSYNVKPPAKRPNNSISNTILMLSIEALSILFIYEIMFAINCPCEVNLPVLKT